MTLLDLQEQCWHGLPLLRKRLAGREAVNDFVTLAVENWQGEYLQACKDNDERSVYATAMLGSIKRGHQVASGKGPQEYGFI